MFRRLVFVISLATVLSAAGTVSAELVAWWRFDDGSGTTAMDSTGNGNDGTLTGGATWTDGPILGALDFSGTNSRVTAPHIPLDNRRLLVCIRHRDSHFGRW